MSLRDSSGSLTPVEAVGLALDVQRKTGRRISQVEEVGIMPLASGRCGKCGEPCRFINIMLCEACLPPPATCDTCGGPAECYSQGRGHRCTDHARKEWGW